MESRELKRPLLPEYSSHQSRNSNGILEKLKDTSSCLSVGKLTSSIINGLKPEIFKNRKTILRPGPTAWLDGLRGCAAFSVCVAHLVSYTHWNDGLCYGHEVSAGSYYTTPIALPFIRILFSGQFFSVVLFFFISGYVLTKRLISLIHQNRHDEFVDSLQSALCRRPGRLFLPVIWSTLALAIIWHATGIATPWPARQPTLSSELNHWFRETLAFIFPFREGILYSSYNSHTWTLPVELRGSVLIYIWLFASSKFATRTRVLMTLIMALHGITFANGVWYSSFLAGLLTAELDLIYSEDASTITQLPWDRLVYALKARPKLRSGILHLLLLAGLYLAGQPFTEWHSREDIMKSCKGWRTLNWLIPSVYDDAGFMAPWRWYWLFWGAWFTLVACKEIAWARKLFESALAQYLGKHSFALYLLHGPLIALVSERLLYLTGAKMPADLEQTKQFGHLTNKWGSLRWWPFPGGGPDGLEPNFLFCLLMSIMTFLYVAELGTKVFDVPSAKVSKWAYTKLKAHS